MDVKTAAKELGLSENRIREFAREGRIGQRVGWQFVFTKEEIEEFKLVKRKRGRPKKEESDEEE